MKILFGSALLILSVLLAIVIWDATRPGVGLGAIGYVPLIVGLILMDGIATVGWLSKAMTTATFPKSTLPVLIVIGMVVVSCLFLLYRIFVVLIGK